MIGFRKANQQGFTIVELMIATSILSTILVTVTVVMVGIGNLYYKGINQSRVQGNVRSLTDEVSQELQLSDGKSLFYQIDGKTEAYCIGNTRYTFILNYQMGDPDYAYKHVLWRDTILGTNCTVSDAFLKQDHPSDGGTELIAPHSRLTNFDINNNTMPLTSPYQVNIGVAYGDNDLLCNFNKPSDCSTDIDNLIHRKNLGMEGGSHNFGDIICRDKTGRQFCAVSQLSTTVAKRLK